jgi:hypothetical protein
MTMPALVNAPKIANEANAPSQSDRNPLWSIVTKKGPHRAALLNVFRQRR